MIRLAIILWFTLAATAWAVEPDEMLSDPALEARARALSAELRCPVCQNENIDESNAQLARDLRIVLRERLVVGDSDSEAVDYLVARYGEFILLNPTTRGGNLFLWLAAPFLFVCALIVGFRTTRARARATVAPLDRDEQDRLDKILKT